MASPDEFVKIKTDKSKHWSYSYVVKNQYKILQKWYNDMHDSCVYYEYNINTTMY